MILVQENLSLQVSTKILISFGLFLLPIRKTRVSKCLNYLPNLGYNINITQIWVHKSHVMNSTQLILYIKDFLNIMMGDENRVMIILNIMKGDQDRVVQLEEN